MILHSILLFLSTFNWYIGAEQISNFERNGQELLLCRKCGTDVADSNYIISKTSPGATKSVKQKLFGIQNVTVQTLVNPFGVKFEVITVEKARCVNTGTNQSADSWFPGYTWRICTCPHCGQHIGWTFEKSQVAYSEDPKHVDEHQQLRSFHGLILSNILGENFTDSLIMMPTLHKM